MDLKRRELQARVGQCHCVHTQTDATHTCCMLHSTATCATGTNYCKPGNFHDTMCENSLCGVGMISLSQSNRKHFVLRNVAEYTRNWWVRGYTRWTCLVWAHHPLILAYSDICVWHKYRGWHVSNESITTAASVPTTHSHMLTQPK